MIYLIYFTVFMLGTIFGSFLNVCIYRMPRGLSVITPRSFCPDCKQEIAWYYNVPLVGILVLGAKCAYCKKPIPLRYFLMEFLSGAMWCLAFYLSGPTWLFIVQVYFLSLLFVVTFTDFETGLIPDKITLPGIVVGLALSIPNQALFPHELWYDRLLHSFLGVLGGGGILYVTGLLGNFLFKKESMGGGDIKLLAMMGAFMGFLDCFFIFMLAPFVALPIALWQRYMNKEETIPYGPYLVFWGVLFFLKGDVLTEWIFKIYGIS